MVKEMDTTKAASLLEKWINFYGMDDRDAWPPEDYSHIKKAREAMELAIEVLRGNTVVEKADIKRAAKELDNWPTVHNMDDPNMWDPMNFPFVKNALRAVIFASSLLKSE